MFLIGLTATPEGKTMVFFNQNLVMQYGHDEAVLDGVNVDFDVYRIRTRVTEQGATILAGETGVYVDKRHKLTRASLGELLLDYGDFLRQRGLKQWKKDSEEAMRVRKLYQSDRSDKSDFSDCGIATASPETAANTLLCLINQASSLLYSQIRQLEKDFLESGGLRERMSKARIEVRAAREAAARPKTPACPTCGKAMRQRTAKTGPKAGQPFPCGSMKSGASFFSFRCAVWSFAVLSEQSLPA